MDWKDEEDPVLVLEAARARQFLESSQDGGELSQSYSEIGEYKPQYSDEPEIQVESSAKITPQSQTQAMVTYLR